MNLKQSAGSVLILVALTGCTGNKPSENRVDGKRTATALTEANVQATIDQWVNLWATYDVSLLPEIFLTTDELTYFSSEKEGLLKGYDELAPHHAGFGFVTGGRQPRINLWLEDVEIRLYGETALVAAVWYTADYGVEAQENVQKGPVTFVLVLDDQGKVKIAHAHFANY